MNSLPAAISRRRGYGQSCRRSSDPAKPQGAETHKAIGQSNERPPRHADKKLLTVNPFRSLRITKAVAAVVLMNACATNMVNPQVPPPGSESFKVGYLNGCASGFKDARREGYELNYIKDEKRYASDGDYRGGWDKGHTACYEEEIRHPKMLWLG